MGKKTITEIFLIRLLLLLLLLLEYSINESVIVVVVGGGERSNYFGCCWYLLLKLFWLEPAVLFGYQMRLESLPRMHKC